MNHWYIGDGVIVRYGQGDDAGEMVRVTPVMASERRKYQLALCTRDATQRVQKLAIYSTLTDALHEGEEWLP